MADSAIQQLENQLENLVTGEANDPISTFLEQQFQLPGNAFAPNGIADASGENPPLRPGIYEAVLNFVIQGYRTKQRQMMILRGDYGTGKTHTLRFIEQIVNTRMSKGEHAARAIYVERPRVEAHELNRTILRSLGYDTVKKYIWFIIQSALAADVAEQSEAFKSLRNRLLSPPMKSKSGIPITPRLWDDADPAVSTLLSKLFTTEVMRDYRTFLANFESKGFRREDLRPYFVDLLLKATGYPDDFDLGQIFVALLLAPDEAKFSSWETLTTFTGVKAAMVPLPSIFLQFLIQIMSVNGIAYVYLLLDEFEEVSQGYLLTPRQRQDYLYTMREVLNRIHSGLSIIIGVSPPGWDAISRIATPFADASHNVIELLPVEADDAVSLAAYYFKRLRQGTQFENQEYGDIRPFTPELVRYIQDRFPKSAQPTSRNWIQLYHFLLERVSERRISDLTPEILQPLLEEFGAMKAVGSRKDR